ncbi:MAG: hypothetical protein EO766_17965 [Hydrotalea sp. AMD]|uniref:hypothetical protein n=1 Tax=Hydrotalea sp. AMD TaxID=2501297 RepID=UPI0010268294|nr:hypothetical protein [Hydrotalea sp. AMD]RWZ82721.1 MAG: hypothetical protein EO766_17965 [Hydrotalea sp. AMD]
MATTLQRSSYTPQNVYEDIHKLFLTIKLSHYKTKSFAAHEAFGRIYDQVNELIDEITEKLIGYSDVDPGDLQIGTVSPKLPKDLGQFIIALAIKIELFAAGEKSLSSQRVNLRP